MSTEIILRYIHFISIFVIAGSLTAEHVLLQKQMTRAAMARLVRIDGIYGIASLTLLAVGLTLWLGGYGKPALYYNKKWLFHIKLGLFVCLGILSIYPTVFFLKQRKGDPAEIITIPTKVFIFLRLELLLLLVIPLLAGLIARGIGYE
jgi:putative membrane protein